MNDWLEWNGRRCTEYGIHVTEQPPVTMPSERAIFTNVPGQNAASWTGNVSGVVVQPNWRYL